MKSDQKGMVEKFAREAGMMRRAGFNPWGELGMAAWRMAESQVAREVGFKYLPQEA